MKVSFEHLAHQNIPQKLVYCRYPVLKFYSKSFCTEFPYIQYCVYLLINEDSGATEEVSFLQRVMCPYSDGFLYTTVFCQFFSYQCN